MRRRAGLRAAAAWTAGSWLTWLPHAAPAAPPAAAVDAADPVRVGRPLRFPRDHGAHLSATIEWWYLTGTLLAADERRFGFQITFFRARTGLADDLPSRFAPRQLLFAHAALTDLAAPAHHHTQRLARWSGDAAAPTAHAKLHDTGLLLGGWTLQRSEARGLSRYETRFGTTESSPAQQFQLDLQLSAAHAPLLQGEAGYSRKGPDAAHASHYVSEPQLAAGGTLQLGGPGGKTLAVRGRAWLDHEWSDSLMHPQAVGWDWVGMNLDDGSALTAFQLRRADGRALWAGGSWRNADGDSQNFAADAVRFTPLQRWRSPASEADYPLHWRLQTPVGAFEVRALLDAQELDSRASTGTVYWEGLSEMLDKQGRRIGLGYLEMTGYAGRLRLG